MLTKQRPWRRESSKKCKRELRAKREMAEKHSERELMSVGELEQRGVQRQTAQTTMSHRGRPVTRLHTVTSQPTGQTGGWL